MEKNAKKVGGKSASTSVSLSKEAMKRSLRPRIGFERIAEQLITLFRDNPEKLAQGGVDLAQLESDLATYGALLTEEHQASVRAREVLSARVFHGSRAYAATLRLYDRAVAVSYDFPAMQNEMANIVSFMSSRRKAKKQATPTPPAPVGSTPTPSAPGSSATVAATPATDSTS